MSFFDRHQLPCVRHRRADEEDGGGDPACAALAAAAAGGLAKLLVAGAVDPESGLERGDMLKASRHIEKICSHELFPPAGWLLLAGVVP